MIHIADARTLERVDFIIHFDCLHQHFIGICLSVFFSLSLSPPWKMPSSIEYKAIDFRFFLKVQWQCPETCNQLFFSCVIIKMYLCADQFINNCSAVFHNNNFSLQAHLRTYMYIFCISLSDGSRSSHEKYFSFYFWIKSILMPSFCVYLHILSWHLFPI